MEAVGDSTDRSPCKNRCSLALKPPLKGQACRESLVWCGA